MAKKKGSMVSVSAIDKVLKAVQDAPREVFVEIGGEELDVMVKPYLSLQEFANMVNSAADAVFLPGEFGEDVYHPEYEEAAKFDAMLVYLCNFKPETSIDRVFGLMYRTDLKHKIFGVWDEAQRFDFDMAFSNAVTHRARQIVADQQNKLGAMTRKLDEAIAAFANINQVFGGLDPAVVQDALTSVAGMDADKLVQAVADRQYEKPDLRVIGHES